MANIDRAKRSISKLLLAAAGVGLFCLVAKRVRLLERFGLRTSRPLKRRQIEVIDTVEQAHNVVEKLKCHCASYRVLGFDCEWVTVGGRRRPVALLQLSSHQGLCALFRLCSMGRIPKGLRDILEDSGILKVGISPVEDAQKLSFDYGVGVAGTLDLRFLAVLSGEKPVGLGGLAANLLNVKLDKSWRISCSDWEARVLTNKQMDYAANDALAAVEIFNRLIEKISPLPFLRLREEMDFSLIYENLEAYLDIRYKDSYASNLKKANTGIFVERLKQNPKKVKVPTRSKIMYDNCYLESPDGSSLCTVSRTKADWYVKQDLGEVVKAEPYTVRLKFDPAGGPVGEVGQYYLTPKDNRCVVCGTSDAYLRKNVVPQEYRKYFPIVMKSHSSHDVLLLCPECHQKSNISDFKIRKSLAEMCNAPLVCSDKAAKSTNEIRNVKSAAKALLYNSEKIPQEKQSILKQTVLDHFPQETQLTEELLQKAVNLESTIPNEDYCPHGEAVVEKFKKDLGGIVKLEQLWREHFLHTMKPQYMPPMWTVDHNEQRLKIRAQQGRVERQELIDAGVFDVANGSASDNKPSMEVMNGDATGKS